MGTWDRKIIKESMSDAEKTAGWEPKSLHPMRKYLPAGTIKSLLHSACFLFVEYEDKDAILPAAVVLFQELQEPSLTRLWVNDLDNLQHLIQT